MRAALTGSAIDIEAPGVDRDSGAGIIDAYAAPAALGLPGDADGIAALAARSGNPLVDGESWSEAECGPVVAAPRALRCRNGAGGILHVSRHSDPDHFRIDIRTRHQSLVLPAPGDTPLQLQITAPGSVDCYDAIGGCALLLDGRRLRCFDAAVR